ETPRGRASSHRTPLSLSGERHDVLRSRAVTALRTTLFVCAALVAFSVARPARAGGATLKRCLELADRNHPDILVSRAKLAQVRAQLDEAHYAPFSGFRIQGGIGLAPTLRGS